MNNQKYFTNGNFERAYEKYFPILVKTISKRFDWSIQDAEDIVQDAMICAYKNKDQFKGDKKSVLSWLWRITTNTEKNQYHYNHTKKRNGKKVHADFRVLYKITPVDLLIRKEIFEIYEREIEKLTSLQKMAVRGRLELGMEHKEIAREYGMHYGYSKSLNFRFRKKAKKELAEFVN